MSTARRRSRDPRSDASGTTSEPAAHNYNSTHPGGKNARVSRRLVAIAFVAISTIIVLAFLILAPQLRPQIFREALQLAHDMQDAETFSRLHPSEHVFREATTHTHTWRVTSDQRRPDGVLKCVYLVNDAFPGPTLEVRPGDRLVIHVENALPDDEGLSIHWHGLSMRDANRMDGAVGLTQAPIKGGSTFTYDFTIDDSQSGTFWWHAHDGVQRADGLYGGIVVHKPAAQDTPIHVADERLLLIGDWYHRSAKEALQFYMHPGAFGLETVPDSLVVNGKGAYTCSDAVPARPVDCIQVARDGLATLNMDAAKEVVLRVVNVGSYAGFSIALPGAKLTPLTVDGDHAIQGHAAKSVGVLHPGERVSLLVEPSTTASQHLSAVEITIDDDPFKYENTALSLVHRVSVQWSGKYVQQEASPQNTFERFDVQIVSSAVDQMGILPSKPDHTTVLYTVTQKLASLENEPHGFINNTMWIPQYPPLIDITRDRWDKHQFVPTIHNSGTSPQWVDIVLNNLDEDSHPFHLHGYDFWVLQKYTSDYNWGSYNPFEDKVPPAGAYNLAKAVKKDTVYVPRRGYVVLRFQADNPGLWMFHCHVLWHQASGMAMALEVQ